MLLQHKVKKVAKAERWAQATEPLPTGARKAIAQGLLPTTTSWEAKGLSPQLLLRETALPSWFAMVWLEILQEKSHVLDGTREGPHLLAPARRCPGSPSSPDCIAGVIWVSLPL